MRGVLSDGVGFYIVFLLLVLSCFYSLSGGLERVLVHSPSEVSMVTPSEGCFNGMFFGGVGSTEIIPGVFALVTRWCLLVAKRIYVGTVVVDDVWVIFVGVDVTFSAVMLNIFESSV